jgi:hypothetical protein
LIGISHTGWLAILLAVSNLEVVSVDPCQKPAENSANEHASEKRNKLKAVVHIFSLSGAGGTAAYPVHFLPKWRRLDLAKP